MAFLIGNNRRNGNAGMREFIIVKVERAIPYIIDNTFFVKIID